MRFLPIIFLFFLLSLTGSSIPATFSHAQLSISTQNSSIARFGVPYIFKDLPNELAEELKHKCKLLAIRLPKGGITIHLTRPLSKSDMTGFMSYVEGMYEPGVERISIWVYDGYLKPKTYSKILHILYHELLHHYDKVTDSKVEYPDNHNKVFDERLKKLGWI